MRGLTTHVLDTMRGRPAEGVAVRLFRGGALAASAVTNADGRCDAPLLEGADLAPGPYRLEFDVGAYFRRVGAALPEPAFLETVALEFGVSGAAHLHVPLLVSPYAYSTYRGS